MNLLQNQKFNNNHLIKTFRNTKLQINLALNYGSKAELIYAFKELKKNKEPINEKYLKRLKNLKNCYS